MSKLTLWDIIEPQKKKKTLSPSPKITTQHLLTDFQDQRSTKCEDKIIHRPLSISEKHVFLRANMFLSFVNLFNIASPLVKKIIFLL